MFVIDHKKIAVIVGVPKNIAKVVDGDVKDPDEDALSEPSDQSAVSKLKEKRQSKMVKKGNRQAQAGLTAE